MRLIGKQGRMRLLRWILALAAVGLTASAISAAPASAGYMRLDVNVGGINCRAEMDTLPATPPATFKLDGTSLRGYGRLFACQLWQVGVGNDPVVTISGGPTTWTAAIDTFVLVNLQTGCTYTANNLSLTSSNEIGPYSGNASATSSCGSPVNFIVSGAYQNFPRATMTVDIGGDICDAAVPTSGGLAPAGMTLLGAAFNGFGATQPCDPNAFWMNGNPTVAFSGSGPWTATVSGLVFTYAPTCNVPMNSPPLVLTSSVSVKGPYSTPSPRNVLVCGGFVTPAELTDVMFP